MPPQSLEDYIAKKLARGVLPRELVQDVCEATGMDWRDAEKYIDEIAVDRNKQISGGRFTTHLAISLATIFIGGMILAYTYLTLIPSLADVMAQVATDSTAQAMLYLGLRYRTIGFALVGLLMVTGGAIGLARAIVARLNAG